MQAQRLRSKEMLGVSEAFGAHVNRPSITQRLTAAFLIDRTSTGRGVNDFHLRQLNHLRYVCRSEAVGSAHNVLLKNS